MTTTPPHITIHPAEQATPGKGQPGRYLFIGLTIRPVAAAVQPPAKPGELGRHDPDAPKVPPADRDKPDERPVQWTVLIDGQDVHSGVEVARIAARKRLGEQLRVAVRCEGPRRSVELAVDAPLPTQQQVEEFFAHRAERVEVRRVARAERAERAEAARPRGPARRADQAGDRLEELVREVQKEVDALRSEVRQLRESPPKNPQPERSGAAAPSR